ncbi:CDP-alcohol phosphatidyltransferase family protein [Vibrio neptunius]|uniref:CDP-alcohol phosphatidyltransferase family protein n=1 Tax=Vibrio neptunius TaxID=170651 RepID=A0ABS3A1Q6_9VIBR|nr:CDP-alcohol phosphatidyltransferase family protein [Vibrio neptunius]MBN3493620.1 CDP-alcohol phosphatidyltransferase family protein [Vibrio neptunius]MBN3516150.1 CDP-alcohol phosphatidyltransferase family protein [Vibrio neptunius]MBN3550387.1 CDP-alcohol phosphatidyltransferase family protein [Vibrio neptunius]MBN3578421.1 CDP-alcohol phosphatidyltransferase family protein [Vibrio neptunius]MCH9872085.1 CDP-alcohol phosphatidyltransferase family protein [Vibrio neptunius]
MPTQHEPNRRPLAVREISVAKRIAVWLSQKNITPNQISLMSMAFAAVGLIFAIGYHLWPMAMWLVLFALMIQMRLLCNLFDGMVAVEGGKKTPAGELFNDVPDRIADPLLIIAAGLVANSAFAMPLAWVAALLAVLSAYIRVLGVSMDCPADFRGPMAKQHRMALLTVTLLLMAFNQWFGFLPIFISAYLMDIALLVMVLGCALTCWRRLVFIFNTKAQLSPLAATEQGCQQDESPTKESDQKPIGEIDHD